MKEQRVLATFRLFFWGGADVFFVAAAAERQPEQRPLVADVGARTHGPHL